MRKTLIIAALATALGAAPAFADCTVSYTTVLGFTVPTLTCTQTSVQSNPGGNSQSVTLNTSICMENGVPC